MYILDSDSKNCKFLKNFKIVIVIEFVNIDTSTKHKMG
jgi:hypothetical protein